MNERIKELILQVGFPTFGKMYVVSDGEELKQFAELIIKECNRIVSDAVDHREPASTYVDKIQKHFGIKNDE
jgi:hypothetical protein